MKKALWVIQENLNRDDKELLPILEQEGIPYKLIQIIPFSETVPDVEWDGPIIARGSTTTLRGAEKKPWSPGVWHNENFKPSAYRDNYKDLFLNKSGKVVAMKDVATVEDWNSRELKFVRPNSDYKELTGRVMTKRDLRKLATGVGMGEYPFDDTLELFIADPRTIVDEARFTVVNGEVISGSFYRRDRRLHRRIIGHGEGSESWWNTAWDAAAMWGPADVYSLDIGRTKTDVYGVIECNCFNASGIYGDAITIVKKVTEFVESKYGQ